MHKPNMIICPKNAAASDETADFAHFADCANAVAAGGEHFDCKHCNWYGYNNDSCPTLVRWAERHPDAPGAAEALALHEREAESDREERRQVLDLVAWAVRNPTAPFAADIVDSHPREAVAYRRELQEELLERTSREVAHAQ